MEKSQAPPHLILLKGGESRSPDEKIISLTVARHHYDLDHCQHVNIEVDEMALEVRCTTCNLRLNPVAILLRMAQEESLWLQRLRAMKDESRTLEGKRRTKCHHCGKMTPVNLS